MALQLNKVFIAGNLVRDPEVRFLTNETSVANFSVASNRRFRSRDGEPRDETTFVEIETWGRTAELVGQYLTKGRACMVEGRLKLDQWEDKDGNKRNRLKVVAESVQFIGGRDNQSQQGQQQPSTPGTYDDDPPF